MSEHIDDVWRKAHPGYTSDPDVRAHLDALPERSSRRGVLVSGADLDLDAIEARRKGRPQGGMKSDAGQAAYWRMQWESAIGALSDLIAEHTETVDEVRRLRAEVRDLSDTHDWPDESDQG